VESKNTGLRKLLQTLLNTEKETWSARELLLVGERALKEKDYEMLSLLAERTDLPRKLKNDLLEQKQVTVKAALSTNSSLTELQQLSLLQDEHRITVLRALGSNTALKPEVAEKLLSKMRKDPDRELGLKLVVNRQVEQRHKAELLELVLTEEAWLNLNQSIVEELVTYLTTHRELIDELVEKHDLSVFNTNWEIELRDTERAKLLTRLGIEIKDQAQIQKVMKTLKLLEKQRKLERHEIKYIVEPLHELDPVWQKHLRDKGELDPVLGYLDFLGKRENPVYARSLKSTDPLELSQLLKEFTYEKERVDRDGLMHLVANPKLSDSALRDASVHLETSQMLLAAKTSRTQKQVQRLVWSCPELLEEQNLEEIGGRELLKVLCQNAGNKEKEWIRNNTQGQSYRIHLLQAALRENLFEELSWEWIRNNAEFVGKQAGAELLEALHKRELTPKIWETLLVLSETFDGTLQQLLDGAVKLEKTL